MLDIKYIRQNTKAVKIGAESKGYTVDLDKLIKLDDERVRLSMERDKLRGKLKVGKKPTGKELKKLGSAKKELQKIEDTYLKVESEWKDLMLSIPAVPRDDVKIGKNESENEIIKKVGKIPKFDYKPKSHQDLSKDIDTDRAAKVSGSRFAYLKVQIAQLELALINYTFDILTKENFIPVFPPVLINRDSMAAMGYLEHGGQNEIYHLKKDDLFLVGTSEQSIGPMHKNEIFFEHELPLRYCAFSTCFRREAGSSGKDTSGILRVHQFDKIEMFSFVLPKDSDKEHEFLLELEERIVYGLGLPYQVTKMVTGDLGMPAARKYDVETWIPSQGKYRETHSTSTCVDFQSRRLNIKYRDDDGNKYFVHTLNGTAVAIGRMIIAIIENYQQKDGSIKLPKILQKYGSPKEIRYE
jgi:seryl-tRNA synthetase